MRRHVFVFLALGLAILTGCSDLFDPAAATVNGEKITAEAVNEALEEFKSTQNYEQLVGQGGDDGIERSYQQAYIAQEIRREILRSAADRLDIEISGDEVDRRIAALKEGFLSEEEFEETVGAQGLTLEEVPAIVRDVIREEKIRAEVIDDLTPTDQEMRAFYTEHKKEFGETRVRHILVNKRARAEEISRRLQLTSTANVDDLFGQLARQFSQDSGTAGKGGSLGYLTPEELERLVPSFQEAVARLETGEISEPVQSEFGFHVIHVVDRRTARFAQVKDEIAQAMTGEARSEAWQRWLVDAYREAEIEVNPRYGELDIETQRIVDPERGDVPGTEATTPPGVEPAG